MEYHLHNREAWDNRAQQGKWYVDTATKTDFLHPLQVVDPCGWLGGAVTGKDLLCLAAGGGRHSVLFAAAGARVTVVDLSAQMLALDKRLAEENRLDIRTIQASMDHLEGLPDDAFDIVVHPVSSCYIPDVTPLYREVARVIRPDGIYVSQHKQPSSLQSDPVPYRGGYLLREPYYQSAPLSAAPEGLFHREAGTFEFLHRWEQLVGELCRAGFVIEDLREPRHGKPDAPPGTFAHRSQFLPPYVKIKARRSRSDG